MVRASSVCRAGRRASLFVASIGLVAAVASAASSQARPLAIDLGDGLGVARNSFGALEPVGFTFGAEANLWRAAALARTGTGRIVAVTARAAGRGLGESGCEVLFTDDLGAHWSRAEWPTSSARAPVTDCALPVRRAGSRTRERLANGTPRFLAFDPRSAHGFAITRDARFVSTDDDGATWRVRQTRASGAVRGWARGTTAVTLASDGSVWLSPDGGFAMRALAGPGSRVETDGEDFLVIDPSSRPVRIDARGQVHGT